MEAILTYKNYQIEISESGNQKPVLPMLMLMYPDVSTAEDFMFITLNKIKSSELEETLLVLPLDVVLDLMQILETLLQSYIFSENMGRIFFFLVEIHFGPLSSSKMAKNLISNIKNLIGEFSFFFFFFFFFLSNFVNFMDFVNFYEFHEFYYFCEFY